MTDYLLMVISAIFVNNILLARYLGNCPFLGVSKKMDTAVGMGMAVIFVLTMAGVVTWFVEMYFLRQSGLVYLRTIVFILVIASLVQFVEIFLKKSIPALYAGLGIFLPLITTNCAVLGVAIINVQKDFNFMQALIFSVASATGFSMALVLFAGLRERMALSRVPGPLEGTAIGLITAGLMSLAFLGFLGMA
nr:electron transport complex subunit RsxA [Desulfobacterales bacterium]